MENQNPGDTSCDAALRNIGGRWTFYSKSSERKRAMPSVVLVVDDDPLVLMVTCMMLDDLGCEGIPVDSGAEALSVLIGPQPVDAMLTDVRMPVMDGYELAEKALILCPGLHIVVASGDDPGRGMFPFLRKPFSMAQLSEAISGGLQ